jgi:hypothetical protein
LLKTEAQEITSINEFIIDVPEIDGATAQDTRLQIVNEGWGDARKNPKLELRFARPMNRDDYVVLGEKTLTVADIDDDVKINIGPYLPPVSQWQTPTRMSAKEAGKNRYLELLGSLSYVDDAGAPQTGKGESHGNLEEDAEPFTEKELARPAGTLSPNPLQLLLLRQCGSRALVDAPLFSSHSV